jgi:hypothetical protein
VRLIVKGLNCFLSSPSFYLWIFAFLYFGLFKLGLHIDKYKWALTFVGLIGLGEIVFLLRQIVIKDEAKNLLTINKKG